MKPSTWLEVKTNTANEETEKLMREDVVVVWGGSNNLGKMFCFQGVNLFQIHRMQINSIRFIS